MTQIVNDVDAQVLQDLRVVEHACLLFGSYGFRTEFWEAFTLLKTGRDLFESEVKRLSAARSKGEEAKVLPLLAERLMGLKREIGLLARGLRELLGRSSTGMLDGMKQDLALVFLMGSAKARVSVDRWCRDPEATAAEANLRLKILSKLVDAYRKALLDARREGTPVSTPETSVRRMAVTTVRLKPEFVDDLRRVDVARRILAGEPSVGWELLCLMLLQRDETRRMIDELEQLSGNAKPGEFAGATYRMKGMLKGIRGQHEPLVVSVNAYLRKIYGSYSGPAEELALAFLVASSQGRHRAKQWLDDPDLCRGEATASVNGLRLRASSYLDAVKHLPAIQPVS